MNTGEFHIALDEKGRLLMPSRIRNELRGNSVVVTRAIDRCLWVFPPEEWREFSAKLMNASSPFSRRGRLLQRRIIAPAQEVELDKTGRLNIPKSLQESAELIKECTLLVMERYMEVWDAGAYQAYEAESESELQEAAEELGGLVSFLTGERMEPVHQSVLVAEVLNLLAPDDGSRLLIDATVGEGGHSVRFLQRFEGIRVIGIDADLLMIGRAHERLATFEGRVELVNQWFDSYFESASPRLRPDRVLMDLGVSMVHFTQAGRGFSFREDEPLDMRLDGDRPLELDSHTAAELVNELPEGELADLIYQYGEERLSRRIAGAICRARAEEPFRTAAQLADTIRGAVPSSYRHSRLHPATRTFQALRIAVNSELDRVRRAIPLVLERLAPAGRLGIISFHSLEDRIVKHMFRDAAATGDFDVLTRKPVIASEEERSLNPASRSAKLRVIERLIEKRSDQRVSKYAAKLASRAESAT